MKKLELRKEFSSVTCLILSYEPVPVIIELSKHLKDQGFNVLIVNDGSSEKFNPIFDECRKYATVLSYGKNHGKGYAIKYGVSYLLSSCPDQKYVITVDGDGQHSVLDIVRVANNLIDDNKIVLGVRLFTGKVPFRSRFGNDWSRFTQTIVTGKYLLDNQCGLRGFVLKDSEWLLDVAGSRYEYEMNVITYLCMHDFEYNQLAIQTIYEKGNPTSHFKPFIDTCKIQAIIVKSGLLSLFSILVQMILTGVFMLILEKWLPVKEPFGLLASFYGATSISFLVAFLLNTAVFRPRRFFYHAAKACYLDICEFVYIGGLMLLFTYVLKIPYQFSYLIGMVLAIIPAYFTIKWLNKPKKNLIKD